MSQGLNDAVNGELNVMPSPAWCFPAIWRTYKKARGCCVLQGIFLALKEEKKGIKGPQTCRDGPASPIIKWVGHRREMVGRRTRRATTGIHQAAERRGRPSSPARDGLTQWFGFDRWTEGTRQMSVMHKLMARCFCLCHHLSPFILYHANVRPVRTMTDEETAKPLERQ